jgi:hypothetical protein
VTTAHVLFEVLAAAVVAVVVSALGGRLRLRCRFPLRPGLRVPVDFLVGSWTLAVIVLLLGLAHLWLRGALLAALALLAVAGRWRRHGWSWSSVAPAALGALVALPAALPPPYFYDALVYHLGLPWQALLEGGLHAHPENVFSSFPPLAQLLAAVPLSVGLIRVPALVHWCSFVAAGAAAGALARELGAPRWAAGVAALCLPLLPGHALVPALPAAEGWALAGVLGATAVVLAPSVRPGGALLAGFLVGVASASRLQGLTWTLLIVGVSVLRSGARWRAGLQGLAGWLAGSAPWWAKNTILLGDPLAPLGWRREGMATLWRDAGSLMHATRVQTAARDLMTGLLPHAAYLVPLLLAVALAAMPVANRRARLAVAMALAGFAAWGLTGSLPRFMTPSVAILAAVGASAARSRAGVWASSLSLGVTVLVGLVLNVQKIGELGGVRLFAGSSASVAPKWVSNDPRPLFAAAAKLPEDARVLFVAEPRGFGFPRRFVAPSQHDVSPLRAVLEGTSSPSAACNELRRQGFTHLLINWGELGRLATGYPVAPWRDRTGWLRWNTFIASLPAAALEAGGAQVLVLPSQSTP